MSREPDLLPDWFLGGAGKRRLLRGLLLEDRSVAPWDTSPPWSKQALARAAELHEKHTVTRHLQVLVEAGVLMETGGGLALNRQSPLLDPLRRLIVALDTLPVSPLPVSRGAR
jgi:hypothetical protein